MKFFIAVVLLALAAVNASASLIVSPYHLGAYPHVGGISLSQGHAIHGGHLIASPYAVHDSRSIVLAHGGAHLAGHVLAAPHAVHVPAPVAVHAAPVLAHSASYVATTRGGQHVADLPGHVQSVASTNVAPAPGTL